MSLVCKVCCDSLAHIINEVRLRGIKKGLVNVDNNASIHLAVNVDNIKIGGPLDCSALSAWKKFFLATKYHTR